MNCKYFKIRTKKGEKYYYCKLKRKIITYENCKYCEEKELYSKAMESGVLNNTRRTHEYIEMLAKISKDKGLDFDFTNNAKLQKSDLSLKYDIGGYNNGESINTNIDSNKALNVIAGHEILHSFENSEGYDTLKKAVTVYAKTKGDYQKVYDKMSELYKDVNGADIDNEVTSELIGNYLFTDKDFIDNLSAKDRNIFGKAFDEVKYLSKVATAGSKEKRQLEKVKHIFDDVYKSKISDYDKNTYVEVQNTKDNVINTQEEKVSQNVQKTVNTDEEYDPFETFGKENGTGLTDDEIAPINTKYSLANKDKIKYNNSTLFTQMMQKVKPDYEGHLVLNDSKNYYLVNKDLNNNFEVLDKIEINDSNKSFIDEMIKEWDYDSGRKSNNDIIEKSQFRKGYSSSNYSYDEENETWFEYAGRILEGDKSENNNSKRNIREGSPNSETRELDNSSFSNDKIPIKKTNDLNEYIADVSSRETQQLSKDKQSAKEMITSYLDENEIIIFNPLNKVKKYKTPKPKMKYWTPKELEQFLNYIEKVNTESAKRTKILVEITFSLGSRIGETRALTFDSFDTAKNRVFINHSINYDIKSNDPLSSTKTYASQREIDITSKLCNIVDKYKKHLINKGLTITGDTLVFSNHKTGKQLSDVKLRKDFYKYCEQAGVPKIRMYDLRHTYVATMMREGLKLYHLSPRIGHVRYSTTVNSYGHLSDDTKKEVAKITDKYIYREEVLF